MNTNSKRQNMRKRILFFSFLIFPMVISYLSPVMILGGASKGIITGSFIVFGLMFVSSLFLGRAWCGWACPASGLDESCRTFRHKKAPSGMGNYVRWAIWLVWIGFMVFLFAKAGGMKDVEFLYQTPLISIMNPYIVYVYFGVTLGIFAMILIWGKRAFCKYLCWMSPFMIIGDRIRYLLKLPGFYLLDKQENCISCGKCTKACPMDIDVQEMVLKGNMQNNECILCLECVDTCPKDAIKI